VRLSFTTAVRVRAMVLEKVRPWAVFMNVRAGHGRGKAMAWPRRWRSATRASDGGLRVRNAARRAPTQERGTGDPRASYWRVHRRRCRSRRTARQGGGQQDSGLPVRAEDGEGSAVTRRGRGEVDAVQAVHDHRCRRTGRRLGESPWAGAEVEAASRGGVGGKEERGTECCGWHVGPGCRCHKGKVGRVLLLGCVLGRIGLQRGLRGRPKGRPGQALCRPHMAFDFCFAAGFGSGFGFGSRSGSRVGTWARVKGLGLI